MNRRTVLRSAAMATTVGLAGCLSGDEPETVLEVEKHAYGQDDDGQFQYELTVTNTGTDSREATLRLTGTLDGEWFEREREVELGAHESATYAIPFDVKAANVTDFSADVVIESDDER